MNDRELFLKKTMPELDKDRHIRDKEINNSPDITLTVGFFSAQLLPSGGIRN